MSDRLVGSVGEDGVDADGGGYGSRSAVGADKARWETFSRFPLNLTKTATVTSNRRE